MSGCKYIGSDCHSIEESNQAGNDQSTCPNCCRGFRSKKLSDKNKVNRTVKLLNKTGT